MNGKTTLLLLLLLGLLAGTAWFQLEDEKQSEMIERSLFEGLVPGQMTAIRVDNLTRNTQLQFESVPGEGWVMTDPIRYPADRAVVANLLENIIGARGLAVPKSERDSKGLGFEPPRAVLEIDQRSETGELTTYVLEIGAQDLDRNLMNVRVEGVYLRALSGLFVPIDLGVEEFRSRHPLTIGQHSVVEILRSGKVRFNIGEEPIDQELIAIRDGNRWYSTTPIKTVLDIFHVGFLVGGATTMKVEAFVEDNCTNFAPYGLDDPLCRVEFKLGNGKSEVLLLSRLGNAMPWHLTREGTPYVWRIGERSALRLLTPAETMADLKFMQALRADVTELNFVSGGAALRMSKGGQGWTVQRGSEAAGDTTLQMADERKIEDALAKLEQLEFAHGEGLEIYGTGGVGPGFRPEGSIEIQVRGDVQGGEFGRVPDRDELFFKRFGDDLPLVAPDWFAELAAGDIGEYRSLQLTRITENDLATIRFTSSKESLVFERDNRGLWHREGVEQEAKELLPMLDSMIYLKARDFPATTVSAIGWIDVEFMTHTGIATPIRIEVDSEGRSLARIGDSQALLKRVDLYASLVAIMEQ